MCMSSGPADGAAHGQSAAAATPVTAETNGSQSGRPPVIEPRAPAAHACAADSYVEHAATAASHAGLLLAAADDGHAYVATAGLPTAAALHCYAAATAWPRYLADGLSIRPGRCPAVPAARWWGTHWPDLSRHCSDGRRLHAAPTGPPYRTAATSAWPASPRLSDAALSGPGSSRHSRYALTAFLYSREVQ